MRTMLTATLILWGGLLVSRPVLAAPRWILQKQAKLPLTAIQLTFQVGTADDPKGKEGLAYLTARLMREGGVKAWKGMPALTRADIQELLSLTGGSAEFQVEKQQITLKVMAPATEADKLAKLAVQMVLAPAWDDTQRTRLTGEMEEALKRQWPREDQEELGKVALDYVMYGADHPYSHVEDGKLASLKAIDKAAIEKFHKEKFTADNLVVGMAGVIDPKLKTWIEKSLAALPKAKATSSVMFTPPPVAGLDLWIVKGEFEGTGVHLGLPLSVNRADADFPALYLGANSFGKHRSFVGRLMRVVREVRGLNYGTYAYAEDFPNGGRLLSPPTQAARSIQAFTMWGRPTRPENGCFLLRQMYRELASLAKDGITATEFELTKSHLMGYVPELALSLDRQLGFAIDSLFYGIRGDYLKELTASISKLKHAEVNAILKKHLKPENFRIVVTASDPEKFRKQILGTDCGISYAEGITKGEEVLKEDKLISETKLPIEPTRIRTLDAEALF